VNVLGVLTFMVILNCR